MDDIRITGKVGSKILAYAMERLATDATICGFSCLAIENGAADYALSTGKPPSHCESLGRHLSNEYSAIFAPDEGATGGDGWCWLSHFNLEGDDRTPRERRDAWRLTALAFFIAMIEQS